MVRKNRCNLSNANNSLIDIFFNPEKNKFRFGLEFFSFVVVVNFFMLKIQANSFTFDENIAQFIHCYKERSTYKQNSGGPSYFLLCPFPKAKNIFSLPFNFFDDDENIHISTIKDDHYRL